jgi:CubicO group peptidase (beta-lactamase class C family)
MAQMIADASAGHHLPGALAALGWGDRTMGVIAKGAIGIDNPRAMAPDSLFRAYSMTKPLTGLIASILIDQGKLKLDQPLADFVPEFANPRVAIDPKKSLDSAPAKGQITIRQLLTHTAGLGYAGIGQELVSAELGKNGVVPAVVTRFKVPELSSPVPTPAPDEFLGLAMERITGKGLEAMMAEHLFGPLGMTSSWFRVPAAEVGRLTSNYGARDGKLQPLDPSATSIYLDAPAFAFGGSGLVSTPADYDRFLAMVLMGGKHEGKQVVSPAAVALATSNLILDGTDMSRVQPAGSGFGAGARVGVAGADAGFYGWGGAASTLGFINRRIGLRVGFWVQYMPSAGLPVRDAFSAALLRDIMTKMPAKKAA